MELANHYSTAFGRFLLIRDSEPFRAEVAPPKGGQPTGTKSTTLLSHENRDQFSGTKQRVPPTEDSSSVMVRGANAEFTQWLRRRALAQYSWLLFSVLDGLRAVGSCVGIRRPRNFQGLRNARRASRPLPRHSCDRLYRHFRNVVDMAVLNNAHE
jgi:hypothetical protein